MAPPAASLAGRCHDLLDFLVLVLSCLPCVADRHSFASVCRLWREAGRIAGAPPLQLPWIISPSHSAATSVFSVLSGTTRRIYLPSDLVGTRLCGSHPGAWLAAAGHVPSRGGRGNVVVNLLSGEAVSLPSEMQAVVLSRRAPDMDLEVRMRQVNKPVSIRAIAFSAAPTSSCIAAAITHDGDRPGIALCSVGVELEGVQCWTVPMRKLRAAIEDVVYFQGGRVPSFHIVTKSDGLSGAFFDDGVREIDQFNYRVQGAIDDMLPTLPGNVCINRYLVESRGKLLRVRRYYSYSQGDGKRQTMLFRVFEWETQDSSWVELDHMGGRAFFLARCSSRAFDLPQDSGIKECIFFFLDDTAGDESSGATNGNQYDCKDKGVYYKYESGLAEPTSWPDLMCSPLYGEQKFVACLRHEGKMETMLFENLQELETYVGGKPVEVEMKGCVRRFIWEPPSGCAPIWFAH